MELRQIARSILAALCVLTSTSSAAHAQVQLTTIVSGLSSPVFVGHAGDGTGRLFIVEQPGVIKVLQPGSSTPTTFLDISAKVSATGERGLLGLAFHPQYFSNRRFFVFYTRQTDGTLVVAEYLASSTDPDVADPAERVFLTIPHSTYTNHNGGMLAFGPDGYLYSGVGDGGGGNDPDNNAQNTAVLLGKILRLDVDHPDVAAGTLYSSPPGNPFVGIAGRDEIFALGMRNPWRFSFDRATGQQWVADVGQGSWEEVDTPIAAGGNYGWRVYEGFECTNDLTLCGGTYLPPLFVYSHDAGRCSITGGYLYRGSAGVLPDGTYVYGDYCSGEIFTWNGSAQVVLFGTTMNISSFGEDQAGELLVVDLRGTISRIESPSQCTYEISPTGVSVAATGDTGTVTVTTQTDCGWTAAANNAWLHVTSGSPGSGNGTVGYSVDANTNTVARTGTLTIASRTFTVNQDASPCTYSISPTAATFTAAGGSGTVTVTATSGCSWTAATSSPWIKLGRGGGSSGSGNGTVAYTVQKLSGKTTSRTGTILIGGQTFTIMQVR